MAGRITNSTLNDDCNKSYSAFSSVANKFNSLARTAQGPAGASLSVWLNLAPRRYKISESARIYNLPT